ALLASVGQRIASGATGYLFLYSRAGSLLIHSLKELSESVIKELDGIFKQLTGDLLHGDASFFKIRHGLVGGGKVGIQRAPQDAVIAEGVHGGGRNGVYRVWTDQLFDVEHIAIFWILGAGAGPE